MRDRNRAVTPCTDPGLWTADERAMFDAGLCTHIVEFGNSRGIIHCCKPSQPGASFGHCKDCHERLMEDYWPDGSPR
jgi:hypothetical protein